MERKHLKNNVRVLLIGISTCVYAASYAMQNPLSTPRTSRHLPKLLNIHKKSMEGETDCHDIKMHAEIVSAVTSTDKHSYKKIDELLAKECYNKHIQEELTYWISLACSQKVPKNAALLCARYEKTLDNSPWESIQEHAFTKADEYGILLEFASSLAKYQKKLSVTK
jgi:hypothetical protein